MHASMSSTRISVCSVLLVLFIVNGVYGICKPSRIKCVSETKFAYCIDLGYKTEYFYCKSCVCPDTYFCSEDTYFPCVLESELPPPVTTLPPCPTPPLATEVPKCTKSYEKLAGPTCNTYYECMPYWLTYRAEERSCSGGNAFSQTQRKCIAPPSGCMCVD